MVCSKSALQDTEYILRIQRRLLLSKVHVLHDVHRAWRVTRWETDTGRRRSWLTQGECPHTHTQTNQNTGRLRFSKMQTGKLCRSNGAGSGSKRAKRISRTSALVVRPGNAETPHAWLSLHPKHRGHGRSMLPKGLSDMHCHSLARHGALLT